MKTGLLGVAIAAASGVVCLFAQDPKFYNPSIDEPTFIAHFFRWFASDYANLEEAVRANPDKANEEWDNRKFRHGMEPGELQKAAAIIRATIQKADALDKQMRDMVEQAQGRRKLPDRNRILDLDAKRRMTFADGVSDLKQQLSPAAWKGLRASMETARLNTLVVPRPTVSK
jgi:hypothetical protein